MRPLRRTRCWARYASSTIAFSRFSPRQKRRATCAQPPGPSVRQGQTIELLAKLTGELDERAQVNIVLSPQWLTIRLAILEALEPFPGARMASGEACPGVQAVGPDGAGYAPECLPVLTGAASGTGVIVGWVKAT